MKKVFSYRELKQEGCELLYLPCGPAQDYTLFKKGDKYGFFRNDDFEMGCDPRKSHPIGDLFGYTDVKLIYLDGCYDACGVNMVSDIPCRRCILALKNSNGWTVYSFDSDLMEKEYRKSELPGLRLLFMDMSKFDLYDSETMLNDSLKYCYGGSFADPSPDIIKQLKGNEIFVFGSNLEGQHGGGAAWIAYDKFGAIWGQGVGLQGKSYAIPTMHGPVESIKPYVDEFLVFAVSHPELEFLVTRIGCGIAGFTDAQIAPLFKNAEGEPNVHLPQSFIDILKK